MGKNYVISQLSFFTKFSNLNSYKCKNSHDKNLLNNKISDCSLSCLERVHGFLYSPILSLIPILTHRTCSACSNRFSIFQTVIHNISNYHNIPIRIILNFTFPLAKHINIKLLATNMDITNWIYLFLVVPNLAFIISKLILYSMSCILANLYILVKKENS